MVGVELVFGVLRSNERERKRESTTIGEKQWLRKECQKAGIEEDIRLSDVGPSNGSCDPRHTPLPASASGQLLFQHPKKSDRYAQSSVLLFQRTGGGNVPWRCSFVFRGVCVGWIEGFGFCERERELEGPETVVGPVANWE
jgi:hypothetical protein